MRRGVVLGLVGIIIAVFIAGGCATLNKSSGSENQNLKVQVQDLQAQVQQKDAEIESLRKSLSQTTEEKYRAVKVTGSGDVATEHPTVRQIQTALKNAGFDRVTIDGKMGSATRKAIRDFQKANNLTADGKVGRKTWSVLSAYLEKSAQQQ